MQKNIIVCPNCERLYQGIRGANILGRIEPDGGFLILRFHAHKTIIYGDHFKVMCGHCKEIIYIHTERRENGTSLNNGSIGIYRAALVESAISKSQSYGTASGTI